MAINFQVFLFDQMDNPDLATEVGEQAIEKALNVVDDLEEAEKNLALRLIDQIRSNNAAFRKGIKNVESVIHNNLRTFIQKKVKLSSSRVSNDHVSNEFNVARPSI